MQKSRQKMRLRRQKLCNFSTLFSTRLDRLIIPLTGYRGVFLIGAFARARTGRRSDALPRCLCELVGAVQLLPRGEMSLYVHTCARETQKAPFDHQHDVSTAVFALLAFIHSFQLCIRIYLHWKSQKVSRLGEND